MHGSTTSRGDDKRTHLHPFRGRAPWPLVVAGALVVSTPACLLFIASPCAEDADCEEGRACVGGVCVARDDDDAGIVSTSDAGAVDAGAVDAGVVDAGAVDAGVVDAGVVDAGAVDAGVVDAGAVDAGVVDAGVVDAGAVDAGVVDAGVVDAGVVDAGSVLGAPGSLCFENAECATGLCKDNVCCAGPCAGDCRTCSPLGGLCVAADEGTLCNDAEGDESCSSYLWGYSQSGFNASCNAYADVPMYSGVCDDVGVCDATPERSCEAFVARDASVSVGCAPSFNHQFSSGCYAGGCEANLPVSSIEDGEVCYTDGAQHGCGSGWCCRPNNGQCDVAANCD